MNKNKITKYLLLFIFIVGIIYFLTNNTYLYYFNIDIFHSDIYKDIYFSIKRIFVGFCIASILGVILAFILGTIKKIFFVKYILELLRPIPPIAWIPLAILRFWLWNNSAYFIVFIGAFFPIFTNTYFWIVSFPSIYNDVSNNFELSKIDYYYNVLFKYSLPYIFSWLKIGLWMWRMSLIAAELIWAQSWLWYYIQINRLSLNIENVILWMILIGLIWFLLSYILSRIEKILVKWWK